LVNDEPIVFDAPVKDAAVNTTRLLCDGVNVGAGVEVGATVTGTAVVATATGVAAAVTGTVVATGVAGALVVLCVQPAKRADTSRSP
jgi:hypothetical protein